MDPLDVFNEGNEEILSQSEVERLLAQVAEQDSSVEVHLSKGGKSRYTQNSIQTFDFRQPVYLAAGELRKLRMRQEEFAKSLAARLSIYLRMEFLTQMSRLQTITFQKFIDNLQSPTHLTLFKLEPLQGVCILEIAPQLGIAMVDRLLGGSARSLNLDHDLSDIESALLDQVVQIVLNEWCTQWAGLFETRPVTVGHESSGRFLQTASRDTVMLVLTLEARLGESQDEIQIAFPCYTLEPLMRQLNAHLDAAAKEFSHATASSIKWNKNFNDMPVKVRAIWDELEMPARKVAQLQIGSILPLGAQFSNHIKVFLSDTPKFYANLGRTDNKWAIELTESYK